MVATRFATCAASAACQAAIFRWSAAVVAAISGRAVFSAAAAAAARRASRLQYGPQPSLWVCEHLASPASHSERNVLFVTCR